MTEYFTNNSRPYAENLNDGILLSDAVDLTVKASIPSMYGDESFNSNLNVERLAGVSVVTMVANTGVTVGSTSLSGTGSVTFRVYPNFSLFERWNRISWTGTGDVSCSLAKVSGESIGVTVENGSTLASHNELSKLQQVDVTFVLSGASVSDISFEFVASADNDLVVASISQSNVAGLEEDLESVNSSLENLDERLDNLETSSDTSPLVLEGGRLYYMKKAGVVYINGEIKLKAGKTSYFLGVLPVGYRPSRIIRYQIPAYDQTTGGLLIGSCIIFQDSGAIQVMAGENKNLKATDVYFNISFVATE